MIIAVVGQAGVKIVSFEDGPADVPTENHICPGATAGSKSINTLDIGIIRQLRGASRENFCVWRKAVRRSVGVAKSGEVVEESDVLRGGIDVVHMCGEQISDQTDPVRRIDYQGAAATIEREATALRRRCVGMKKRVVESNLHDRSLAVIQSEAACRKTGLSRGTQAEGKHYARQNYLVESHDRLLLDRQGDGDGMLN